MEDGLHVTQAGPHRTKFLGGATRASLTCKFAGLVI